MKKLILTASLIFSAILVYRLNENKKDLYDVTERANFYKKKYDEYVG